MAEILHATLVVRRIDGRWRGALLRGPSGAGKSTAALRCLDAGFRLVADDRVIVFAVEGRVFGRAPAVLVGLIEVRAVGVTTARDVQTLGEIDLVVDARAEPERLPDPETVEVAGVRRPRLHLDLRDPDLPLRLTAALAALQRRL